MSFEDDLRRVEEHVAEARRLVQRQKGQALIVRLRAAGANTLDAQRILWLLESNLRRFEQYRNRLRANVRQERSGVTGWPSLTCGLFSSSGSFGMLVAMHRATTNVAVTRQPDRILPVAVPRSGLAPSYTERRAGSGRLKMYVYANLNAL